MSQSPEIEGMVELMLDKVLGCRSPGTSRALSPGWSCPGILVLGEGPSLTPRSPLWAVSATSLSLKEGYQACKLGRIDFLFARITLSMDFLVALNTINMGFLLL